MTTSLSTRGAAIRTWRTCSARLLLPTSSVSVRVRKPSREPLRSPNGSACERGLRTAMTPTCYSARSQGKNERREVIFMPKSTNSKTQLKETSVAVGGSTGAEPNGSAPVTDGDVARRAYDLYLARGSEAGHDVEDWLQAERELRGP